MPTLAQLITPESLENLAGSTAFERGRDYLDGGLVERLRRDGDRVSARVRGTETYRVELWPEGRGLGFSCTCPRAADGYFCKHCVAVGLAVAENVDGIVEAGGTDDPEALIRRYLEVQTPEFLVCLLMEQSRKDEGLFRSLLLKAQRASNSVDAIKAYTRAILEATEVGVYLDWGEVGGFAEDIERLTDSLEELLEPGTAAALVQLAELAIERLDRALGHIDDSNGETAGILERLADLHHRACVMARPDPVALAERLFRFETGQGFDAFYDSLTRYADILGAAGLARFRELAEEQWRTLGERKPGDQGYEPGRYAITRIMENLARQTGDVEALVAVKSRDLSYGYDFLQVAEIYRKAGQPEKALEWAERGLAAFPSRPDNRLRDFLVEEYSRLGRLDDALDLRWRQFEEMPSLADYRALRDASNRDGRWEAQRQRALALLDVREAEGAKRPNPFNRGPTLPEVSTRVEIALWEDDLETAWQKVHHGRCRRDLFLALAGKLEQDRPADAVALYRQIVPEIVEETNNRAYEEAVRLLRRTRPLLERLGQAEAFRRDVVEMRVRFKAKRNFVKLLDGLAAG